MSLGIHTSANPHYSRLVIWVAAIANVLVSSGFSYVFRGYAPLTGPPLEAGYSLFVQYGIAAVAMGCTFKLYLQRPFLLIRGFWLLAAAIFPFASILWSPDYYETFRQVVILYAALFTALATAFYFSPGVVIQIAIRAATIILIASLATIILFPAYGVHPAIQTISEDIAHAGDWRGIFNHKNQFGEAMGIGLIILIMARRIWLPARLGLLSLAIVSLAFSGSASPLVLSPCALIIAAFISPRCFSRSSTAILRILGILSLFGICVLFLADPNFELTLKILGRDPTLTGRVQVWYYVFDQLNNPLFFGLGYQTGYGQIFFPAVSEAFGASFSTVHNGFIDVYIGLGLVGLSLYLLLVLSALYSAISFLKSSDPDFRDLGRVAVVLILYYLLSSLTETGLLTGGNPVFATSFLFIATIIVHRPRRRSLWGPTSRALW